MPDQVLMELLLPHRALRLFYYSGAQICYRAHTSASARQGEGTYVSGPRQLHGLDV